MKPKVHGAGMMISIALGLAVTALVLNGFLLFGSPVAKITAKVVSEDGAPVQKAEVGIGFLVGLPLGQGPGTKELTHIGTTGEDGVFTATDQSGIGVGLRAEHDGYYRTYGPLYLFREVKHNQWQPWNPTIELVLKPIVNPIPMYVRKMDAVHIPLVDQPVGFDLIESDWVAPHGKGKVSDLLFTLKKQFTSVYEPFDAKLTVRFSNQDDGIQSVIAPVKEGSELRLPRFAPEGGYQAELIKSNSRKAANAMIELDYRADQNYFFRVRTVKKDNKIVSAHYGKIHGDINFDIINSHTALLFFTYYLNPTPNDRNMEFDPKRNLFTDLKSSEKVSSP